MEKWQFKDVTVYRFVCYIPGRELYTTTNGSWCESADLAVESLLKMEVYDEENYEKYIIEIQHKRLLLDVNNKKHMELYDSIVTYAKLRRENAERKQKKV